MLHKQLDLLRDNYLVEIRQSFTCCIVGRFLPVIPQCFLISAIYLCACRLLLPVSISISAIYANGVLYMADLIFCAKVLLFCNTDKLKCTMLRTLPHFFQSPRKRAHRHTRYCNWRAFCTRVLHAQFALVIHLIFSTLRARAQEKQGGVKTENRLQLCSKLIFSELQRMSLQTAFVVKCLVCSK